ncbi:MAG: hypothetical protein J6P64_06825, partial [Bacteroidales bacterium]|nr:hypothetical protein [Bacteroidales bacterium]
MEGVFKKIAEQWFLREPAFFALYCIQQLEVNDKMNCAMRCGQGKLQYNPTFLERKSTADVELLLKIEMIRLFLKHPYERQPEGTSRIALALGSDVTIKSAYNGPNATGIGSMSPQELPLLGPEAFGLQHDMPFEWYVRKIEEMLDEDPVSPSNQKDLKDSKSPISEDTLDEAAARSELWEEDEMRSQEINDLIDKM